jgi:exodeoxyribonuclease V alpha subunit
VRVELDRSRRQSAALDVSALSASIRAGDSASVVAGLRDRAYRGVHWRSGRDAALAEFVLDHALPHYRAIADAPDVATALALLRRHRVLTAVREGDAGSQTLNARIALALQRAGARDDAFFHGRPVMIRENSYRHGLYNGDVGPSGAATTATPERTRCASGSTPRRVRARGCPPRCLRTRARSR